MFEYYSIQGTVSMITSQEANVMMNSLSNQWEEETTNFGKLYTGVYDWAYTKDPFEIHIPKLRNGGSIPINEIASKKFGFDIFGDCFLRQK